MTVLNDVYTTPDDNIWQWQSMRIAPTRRCFTDYKCSGISNFSLPQDPTPEPVRCLGGKGISRIRGYIYSSQGTDGTMTVQVPFSEAEKLIEAGKRSVNCTIPIKIVFRCDASWESDTLAEILIPSSRITAKNITGLSNNLTGVASDPLFELTFTFAQAEFFFFKTSAQIRHVNGTAPQVAGLIPFDIAFCEGSNKCGVGANHCTGGCDHVREFYNKGGDIYMNDIFVDRDTGKMSYNVTKVATGAVGVSADCSCIVTKTGVLCACANGAYAPVTMTDDDIAINGDIYAGSHEAFGYGTNAVVKMNANGDWVQVIASSANTPQQNAMSADGLSVGTTGDGNGTSGVSYQICLSDGTIYDGYLSDDLPGVTPTSTGIAISVYDNDVTIMYTDGTTIYTAYSFNNGRPGTWRDSMAWTGPYNPTGIYDVEYQAEGMVHYLVNGTWSSNGDYGCKNARSGCAVKERTDVCGIAFCPENCAIIYSVELPKEPVLVCVVTVDEANNCLIMDLGQSWPGVSCDAAEEECPAEYVI